uniref:Peptidase S1 domain-containing protein n=1 Tax=Vibrio sp. 23023 TaxID=452803 RepID=A9M4R7_9VIBR|nr:trypsin-like peptidase domain-containing protein [Vibrio sp. 23023]ABX77009.1 Hypothetical protein BMSA_0049 [Vibrio sp. 23023]
MKSLNLALSLTSLFVAAQASAMYYPYNEQGQPYLSTNHFDAVDWSQHQSLIYAHCTAQIIAGKYLLTAGHCVHGNLRTYGFYQSSPYSEWRPEGSYSQVKTLLDDSNEDAPSVLYSFWHQPNQAATVYVDSRFVQFAIPTNGVDGSKNTENLDDIKYDIAIFTLKEAYPHVKTAPFLESAPTQVGDDVRIFGARYLGDQYEGVTTRELRSGTGKLQEDSWDPTLVDVVLSDYVNKSIETEEGDSGGMWLNDKDRIVGITRGGGNHSNDAALIANNTDFLLESINAWHSVTYADIAAGKQKTIELQNLHSNTLDLANTITKTGDVDIDDNQCANVAPFETCQITLSSVNGQAGVVTLEDGFNIYINDVPEHYKHPRTTPHTGTDPKQQPVQPPSQGGGGGSMGWDLLLLLGGLGLLRRKHQRT